MTPHDRPLVVLDSLFVRALLEEFADSSRWSDVAAMTALAAGTPEALEPPVNSRDFPHAALLRELVRGHADVDGLAPAESVLLVLRTLPRDTAPAILRVLKPALSRLLAQVRQPDDPVPADREAEVTMLAAALAPDRRNVILVGHGERTVLPAPLSRIPVPTLLRRLLD